MRFFKTVLTCSFVLCASCLSAAAAEDGVFPKDWGESKAKEALLRAQAEKQQKDAADAKKTDTKTNTDTKTGPKDQK